MQDLTGWSERRAPDGRSLAGRHIRLDRLDVTRHAASFRAASEGHDALWDYMGDGPFADGATFTAWLARRAILDDPLSYALVAPDSGDTVGTLSLMAIRPRDGVLEIGQVLFTPHLQKSPAATEAIALVLAHAFDDLGYRRVEWKCNAENAASQKAALRFGFQREGLFRQHMVVKGRNRDTAWFAMLDGDWPARRAAFEAWLRPDNFDSAGRQRQALAR